MSILREFQNDRCYLCGHLLAPTGDMFAPDRQMQSVDHVVPRSHGGPNRLGNIALAHKGCNNKKADRAPTACEVFFAESMAQCFEDSHVREPYQLFGADPADFEADAKAGVRAGDFRLQGQGNGMMYVRRSGEQPYVISKAYYRTLLKRKALKGAA